MRKVVLYTLLSLDGVAEEPGDWMFDVDQEVVDNLARVIQDQDAVLLGRGTYDYWVDYWPTSDVRRPTLRRLHQRDAEARLHLDAAAHELGRLADRRWSTRGARRRAQAGARGRHRGPRESDPGADPAPRRPGGRASPRRRTDPGRTRRTPVRLLPLPAATAAGRRGALLGRKPPAPLPGVVIPSSVGEPLAGTRHRSEYCCHGCRRRDC